MDNKNTISIKFTALPKQFLTAGARTLLLSTIFITPEITVPIDDEQPLKDFEIFNDWPKTLENWIATNMPYFGIDLANGQTQKFDIKLDKPFLSQDLSPAWNYLFDEDMPVNHKDQNNIYQDVDPGKLKRNVLPETAAVNQYTTYLSNYYNNKLSGLGENAAAKIKIKADFFNGQCSGDLIKHLKYQSVSFSKRANTDVGSKKLKNREKLTFNQLVSHLGQFPAILKGLGLLVDITVDVSNYKNQINATQGNIYVGFTNAAPQPAYADLNLIFPKIVTNFNLSDPINSSTPAHNPAPASDGTVVSDLISSRMVFISDKSNKDASIPKSIVPDIHDAVAISYKMQKSASGNTAPDELPYMTHATAGIVLNHENFHAGTKQRMLFGSNPAATKNGAAPVFYAEDLIRGYRIDVQVLSDNGIWGNWASLCRQNLQIDDIANYLPAYITDMFDDCEGWVSIAQTYAQPDDNTPSGPADGTYLVVPGALTRWEGWSLCVPRPGKGQLNSGETGVSSGGYKNFKKLKIKKHVVPGSLIGLRYGKSYRFRIRTVDIAGNGLSLGDATKLTGVTAASNYVTDAILFSRPEGLQSPVLVPHEQIFSSNDGLANLQGAEGENVDVMVVRSDYSQFNDALVIDTNTNTRHILPPQVSPDMAEKMGEFDGMKALKSYQLIDEFDGVLSEKGFEYVDQLTNPYLPDPAVVGFLITGPGVPQNTQCLFYGKDKNNFDWEWPYARPWKIIAEPIKPPNAFTFQVDEQDNAVIFKLPQDDIRSIEISPLCTNAYLAKKSYLFTSLGIKANYVAPLMTGSNITSKGSILQYPNLKNISAEVFPAKVITLIHAVQKTPFKPAIKDLAMTLNSMRNLNATYVDLTLTPSFWQAKASEKLELFGTWVDYEDTQDNFGQTDERNKKVFEFPLNYQDTENTNQPNARDEFGDTKRRIVTYQIANISRFGGYFPAGTDLTRISDINANITIDIPSSARPKVPAIKRVVPTYAHIRNTDTYPYVHNVLDVNSSKLLHGNGVRIYLEAGDWYSSGIGEVLGVVVLDAAQVKNFAADSNDKDVFVLDNHMISVVGKDVTHDTNPLSLLTPSNFDGNITADQHNGQWFQKYYLWKPAANNNLGDNVNRQFTVPEVTISATPNGTDKPLPCNIIRFNVERTYDNNELYADIIFKNIDTYFPFVRLVLVRLQPNAIDGCNVSSVVQLDYCQLPSNRLITISHRLGKITKINIDTCKQTNGFNQFFVAVEAVDPLTGIIFRKDKLNDDPSSNIGKLFQCVADPKAAGNWTYDPGDNQASLPYDIPLDHEIVVYEFENFGGDSHISTDPLNDNLMRLVSMESVNIF